MAGRGVPQTGAGFAFDRWLQQALQQGWLQAVDTHAGSPEGGSP